MWRIMLLVFVLSALIVPCFSSQAGVSLSPRRVILEGRQRSQEIALINQGSEATTYRISLIDMKMSPAGKLEPLPEGATSPNSASRLLRFSPRQVTIPAGGSQRVRLMVRKPATLPAGEYRSHMLFSEVRQANSNEDIDSLLSVEKGKVAVSIQTTSAITIPLFVRHGQGAASATMKQLTLKRIESETPTAEVELVLARSGRHSFYGDIEVYWHSDSGEQLISQAYAVPVYYPVEQRTISLQLNVAPEKLTTGELVVQLRPFKNKSKLLDEVSIKL